VVPSGGDVVDVVDTLFFVPIPNFGHLSFALSKARLYLAEDGGGSGSGRNRRTPFRSSVGNSSKKILK
jgi:hypothetical protein